MLETRDSLRKLKIFARSLQGSVFLRMLRIILWTMSHYHTCASHTVIHKKTFADFHATFNNQYYLYYSFSLLTCAVKDIIRHQQTPFDVNINCHTSLTAFLVGWQRLLVLFGDSWCLLLSWSVPRYLEEVSESIWVKCMYVCRVWECSGTRVYEWVCG